MTSAPAIAFDYRPSRWLARALGVTGVLAVVAIWLCGMPWWGKPLLSAMTAFAVVRAIRHAQPVGIAVIRLAADGGWLVRDQDGVERAAVPVSVRVFGSALWLTLRLEDHRRASFFLAPDNVDAGIRRRLRMRLGPQLGGAAARDDAAHST